MSTATEQTKETAPPEEVARRIREFREAMYDRRVEAVVVWHPQYHRCPWPDCEFCIKGGRIPLERMGNEETYQRLIKAFWLGPGLVGRCPGCGRFVRYDVERKEAIPEPIPVDAVIMPDNWFQLAAMR